MKKQNMVRFICTGGILTTIAVLFQAAPVFLPALGLVFSPFSTLPIALAAFLNIPLGITVLFASSIILIFVDAQETIILLFATGLLGIVTGSLLFRKGLIVSVLFSTLSVFVGLIILIYLVSIPVFGDSITSLSTPFTLFAILVFLVVYVSIWNVCLKKFINYLVNIKLHD